VWKVRLEAAGLCPKVWQQPLTGDAPFIGDKDGGVALE
jgi:hypothetical protein